MAGRTEDVLAAVGDMSQLLTATERRRAGALRFPRDRTDFAAAHALVRLCAAEMSGASPTQLTLVQRCDECGGGHGRPALAEDTGLQVSLSHTAGYVAAMAGAGPVGVDVERGDDSRIDPDLMRSALSPSEVAAVDAATPWRVFLRQWVRKEALVKVGRMRLEDMAGVDLSALPAEARDRLPKTAHWEAWHVLDWSDPEGVFLGSAVSVGPARLQILVPPPTGPVDVI
jgi:4'-phosphopantetheinyl transferase